MRREWQDATVAVAFAVMVVIGMWLLTVVGESQARLPQIEYVVLDSTLIQDREALRDSLETTRKGLSVCQGLRLENR